MFQYSFGYALSQLFKQQLKLDLSEFDSFSQRSYALGHYEIPCETASSDELKRFKKNGSKFTLANLLNKHAKKKYSRFKETHFSYSEPLISENTLFEGYWQSEKYFIKSRMELLKTFDLSNKIHTSSENFLELINTSCSVSIHIRRGDYITSSTANAIHGTCPIEYYQTAIQQTNNRLENPVFFIFSDDLEWCAQKFSDIAAIHFVQLHPNANDQDEIYLMSCCDHNIIANSSFSWWGAWLNTNPNKVVMSPSQWFRDPSIDDRDLIPKNWNRI